MEIEVTPSITLTNIGPVEHLRIPVPPDGGVVVLRGRNGSGKSVTLDAVRSAVTGEGRPPLRDHQPSGSIEAFGVNVRVGKRTTRSGELEVTSIEGRLSMADLVDPGIQDPERADAARIKALLALAGAETGSETWESFPPALTADLPADPITAAAQVKARADAKARELEREADRLSGRIEQLREQASADMTAESDPTVLQERLEAAIAEHSRIRQKRESASEQAEAAEKARAALEAAKPSYSAEAEMHAQAARERYQRARAEVERIQEELSKARHELQMAEEARGLTEDSLKHAKEHDETLASWREMVAQAQTPGPTDEDVERAGLAVQAARNAIEAGAAVRKARAAMQEMEGANNKAKALAAEAESFRAAGRSTDEVLSRLVAGLGSPLSVSGGRLVLSTRRGEGTPYGELSEGERWRIAIDIAADATTDAPAIMVIPQEAWEGLDPINRKAVAEHARERKLLILTAEPSMDDRLTVSVEGGEALAA